MQQFIKKYYSTILLATFLCIVLFVPNAKSFLLRGLLQTGIFNASTKKEAATAQPVILSFSDKNGNLLNTADLKGKVIFINFWATWCPPCMAEMGSINALYNKLKTDPRFIFVLADADNNLTRSMAFMDTRRYNLPVYEVAGAIPNLFFSGTLPTTLIIDANGRLVQKHEGMANYDTEAMVQMLQSLLK